MMWWTDGWGTGWGLAMMAGMVLFWAVVLWAVVTVVRSTGPRTRDAQQILEERYASGEIDTEEFERRRAALRR